MLFFLLILLVTQPSHYRFGENNSRLQTLLKMKETTKLFALVVLSVIAIQLGNLYSSESNDGLKREYEEWKNKFGKQFIGLEESSYRYEIFQDNRKKVKEHNKLAQAGKSKYFMALNQFADLTQAQFKHHYGHASQTKKGLRANITTKCTGSIQDAPNPPQKIDWTQKAVNPNVSLEGKCSANWAFSAVAAVEGIYAIKMEKLIKLSDQQVIDCSGDYGNQGCGGGFMDQAYWYMIDQGMTTQNFYPYTGQNKAPCNYTQAKRAVTVGRCARVPSQVYNKLVSAVIRQPVSVAVASQKFMLYDRGIFDGECSLQIDRGMLLVGYGTEDNVDYWTLKNSLGITWGEKGYLRLKRTAEDGPGLCGILLAPSLPQNVE